MRDRRLHARPTRGPRRLGSALIGLLVAGGWVLTAATPAAAETVEVDHVDELAAAFANASSTETDVVRLGSDLLVTRQDPAIAVPAGRSVALDLNGFELAVTGADFAAGIGVGETSTLIIRDSGTDGLLIARGGVSGAGIGGGASGSPAGTITIEDGTVRATGGESATGIGGGYYGAGGTVTINGGTIEATGSWDSAGIGGGRASSGGTVTINGGTVTATGDFGAGIGAGYLGDGGTIAITGGSVTARGSDGGTGIGGGPYRPGGSVTIQGGTVHATGGGSGAGIGGGNGGGGGTITIDGGTVTATGGRRAAGIGGGNDGEGGTILVDGGAVTATGGSDPDDPQADGGAGIGGGAEGAGGTIAINDGSVVATAGTGGAGIGSGRSADADTIRIGAAAAVMVAADSGSAVGSGLAAPEENPWTLDNAGSLTIASGVITIPADVTVINSGLINGSGSIAGGGTIENTGAIWHTVGVGPEPRVLRNHYLLTFDPQGGTGQPDDLRVYGPTLESTGRQVPADEPTRPGHTFTGWYSTPEDSGTRLTSSSSLGAGTGPVAAPQYARWISNAPTLNGPATATFMVGEDGTYSPTVTGDPAPRVTATGLPSGLVIDPATGKIAGAPEPGTEGDHEVVLTASNGVDPDAILTVTFTVRPAPITQFDLEVAPATVPERSTITISGGGLPSGTEVALAVQSDPVGLGTVTAGADGSFALTVALPAGVKAGDHRVVATAQVAGDTLTESVALTVIKPGEPTPPEPTPTPTEPTPGEPNPTGPGEPSMPGSGDPTPPSDDPGLPNTGGPSALILVVAVASLAGAGLVLRRRRRPGRHLG